MSQPVYGTIVNYRIGIRTQMPKWCLIQIADANSTSKAGQLIGRKVILKYGKNNFIGKIVGLHGKKGVVKAKFHKGVPGRAIGATVIISPKRSTTLYSQAKTSTPKRFEDKRKKKRGNRAKPLGRISIN